MNTFNFNQTAGYPFETDDLQRNVDSLKIIQELGRVLGDQLILSGCYTGLNGFQPGLDLPSNGSLTPIQSGNISDGYVYYNGEVLPFVGGLSQSRVKVFEQDKVKTFEDGADRVVGKNRWVGFTSSLAGSMSWSSFKRIGKTLEELQNMVPRGVISMWSGEVDNIPEGYALCDGQNGTPDLRGRFIVGYDPDDDDYNEVGNADGLKKVELSKDEMPQHNHEGTVYIHGHSHELPHTVYSKESGGVTESNALTDNNNISAREVKNTLDSDGYNNSFATSEAGESEAHENRPPYFTLAYIMKL